MRIHLLWSNQCLWSNRCHSSGCNCGNRACRKGRETGEGSRNSHFQLQPDVRSRARRRHRKGEPEFFSSGRGPSRIASHRLGKKGSRHLGKPKISHKDAKVKAKAKTGIAAKRRKKRKREEPQIGADFRSPSPLTF